MKRKEKKIIQCDRCKKYIYESNSVNYWENNELRGHYCGEKCLEAVANVDWERRNTLYRLHEVYGEK